jgi:DNA-binding phage protein
MHKTIPAIKELDAERQRRGLSKRALAHLAAIPEDRVYRLLSANPRGRLDTLVSVAVALGAHLEVVPRKGKGKRTRIV